MIKAVVAQFEIHDRRIFWIFAALLLLALGIYIYFLSIAVVAVVSRRSAEQQAVRLSASISILETQYVA